MVRLVRLMAVGWLAVSLFFLAVVPLRAHAYGTVAGSGGGTTTVTQYQTTDTGDPPSGCTGGSACSQSGWQSSASGACNATPFNPTPDGTQSPPYRVFSMRWYSPTSTCYLDWYYNTDTSHSCATNCGHTVISVATQSVQQSSPPTCPAHSQLARDQTTCVCSGGYAASGGSGGGAGTTCVASACPSGTANILVQTQQVSGTALTLCNGGCVVRGQANATGQDGRHWVVGPFSFTGGTCEDVSDGEPTGSSDLTGNPWDGNSSLNAPATCGAGQCPGTVNGASVCVACSSTSTSGATSVSTNASGATTGSSSVQTTCSSGSCTTVTTTFDSSGNSTGSQAVTMPLSQYCTTNPSSAQCTSGSSTGTGLKPGSLSGNGTGTGTDSNSSFSGACAATTCSGDAVQCAIAAEQYKRDCQLFDTSTPEAQAYQTASQGGVVSLSPSQLQPGDHPGNAANVTSVSSGQLSDAALFSGQSCVADVPFTVGGRSYSMPLSKVCTPASYLGLIGMALAALHCLFMLREAI